MSHEYKVGDPVYVIEFNGKPKRSTSVTAIKEYKRGPRVTTADGSEWDVSAGCMWGQRSANWNTGPHLEPQTEKLDAAYANVQGKRHADWFVRHWNRLSPEQVEEFLTFARKLHREVAKVG